MFCCRRVVYKDFIRYIVASYPPKYGNTNAHAVDHFEAIVALSKTVANILAVNKGWPTDWDLHTGGYHIHIAINHRLWRKWCVSNYSLKSVEYHSNEKETFYPNRTIWIVLWRKFAKYVSVNATGMCDLNFSFAQFPIASIPPISNNANYAVMAVVWIDQPVWVNARRCYVWS